VRKTIRENKLIDKRDRIAVALSGGKDSLTTLYLLKKIFKNNSGIKLIGITIDQGFGSTTKYEASLTKQICEDIEIEHHTFSFKEEFNKDVEKIIKNNKFSYCAVCGVLRRSLINRKARELKCKKLATGHNLDDECQNVLMNIIKGDMISFARVGAMPMISNNPKFVPRIKPLINIPEKEVVLFAKIKKIKYSDKKCPYRKFNTLRGETIKYLNNLEKNSPGIKYSLLNNVNKIVPNIRKVFEKDQIKICKKCGEPTSQEICRVCEIIDIKY